MVSGLEKKEQRVLLCYQETFIFDILEAREANGLKG